jgi:hypothetical protein
LALLSPSAERFDGQEYDALGRRRTGRLVGPGLGLRLAAFRAARPETPLARPQRRNRLPGDYKGSPGHEGEDEKVLDPERHWTAFFPSSL